LSYAGLRNPEWQMKIHSETIVGAVWKGVNELEEKEKQLPCYVGPGQEQCRFLVSNNNTAASRRIDTNALSVAILLLQRSPYGSGMRPSPEPWGPHSGSFGFESRAGPEPQPFDDKQPAIR